jgi:hemerythrin
MPFAAFTDELLTGIEVVDAQHKALFEAVATLSRALQDGATEDALMLQLALIAQRTIFHFHTEEELMKAHHYPGRTFHGAEHLNLILKVREIQYKMAKGHAATVEITRFLAEWFGHHVQSLDMDYASYMKSGVTAWRKHAGLDCHH